ncbi:hypothetical protein [Pseudonocardia sp. ICBG1293]|uniref:hypothetical protein n=1 Tax=Pseudonocardia sp. ICBG1293 TaxID=2844382 RepID=UPI001CCFEB74|nr:hypothetical protein [Pseudonocardia sp. ICBG1293]
MSDPSTSDGSRPGTGAPGTEQGPVDDPTAETHRWAVTPPTPAAGPPSSRRRLALRAGVLALVVAAGAGAGAGYGLVSGPTFRTAAYVAVTAQDADGQQRATSFAQAFGRIAGEPAVAAAAAAQLRTPVEQVLHRAEVQTSPDAPLVEVAGLSGDPREATATANALAGSLVAYGNQRSAETGVALAVFAPAVEPVEPVSASPALLAMVGGAAGVLLAGLGLFAASSRAPRDFAPAPAPATPPAPGRTPAAAPATAPASVPRRNGVRPASTVVRR